MNAHIQHELSSTAPRPWNRPPSLRETICIWATMALLFVGTASAFRPYLKLARDFGDTAAYIEITNAIRTWTFSGIHVKHFWGLPYAAAALSRITGLSAELSLLAICSAASLAALILAYRLWDAWIALFAALLSFDWMQRSFLGGSEPLFVALLFGSFLAIRKEHWAWAALLASLATITRPLGGLLLVGMGITLLWRKDWRRLAWITTIALLIGFLYAIPLQLYLHDPLATVHSYASAQPTSYPPLFGIPFRAIIVGTLRYPSPWSNLLYTFGWILLVLGGNVAMFMSRQFRTYAKEHPPEMIFTAAYLLSLYCYNAPAYARGNFARFAIPIVPFILLALSRCLPKDRRLLWCLAVVSPVLAASSAIGIQNVIAALRHGH